VGHAVSIELILTLKIVFIYAAVARHVKAGGQVAGGIPFYVVIPSLIRRKRRQVEFSNATLTSVTLGNDGDSRVE
jgi:hypothetical protein